MVVERSAGTTQPAASLADASANRSLSWLGRPSPSSDRVMASSVVAGALDVVVDFDAPVVVAGAPRLRLRDAYRADAAAADAADAPLGAARAAPRPARRREVLL